MSDAPNDLSYFDDDAFVQAANAFMIRHGATRGDLAAATGIAASTANRFLRGRGFSVTVGTAAAIAYFCDLSLDSYVREL